MKAVIRSNSQMAIVIRKTDSKLLVILNVIRMQGLLIFWLNMSKLNPIVTFLGIKTKWLSASMYFGHKDVF